MFTRIVLPIVLVLLLAACATPPGQPAAPAPTAPAAPAPQPTTTSIMSGTAQDGEHLASVFDRLTGTDIGSYAEFGYCWTSQAAGYTVRFADKYAFIWGRGVVYLPDMWPGDAVSIGTRAEIEQSCAEAVVIASRTETFDTPPLHGTRRILSVSGGPYADRSVEYILMDVFGQEGEENWVVDDSGRAIPASEIFIRIQNGMTVGQAIIDYRQNGE